MSESGNGAVRLPAPSAPSARLAKKILAVVKAIEGIAKRGVNEHFQYAFVMESDAMAAARKACIENNVLLIPSVVDAGHVEMRTAEGKIILRTDVWLECTWVDVDSGDSWQCRFPGTAFDTGDKGIYKALTGAMKYMLLKTLLVSSHDDPEFDPKTRRAAKRGKYGSPTQDDGSSQNGAPGAAPASRPASERDRTKWRASDNVVAGLRKMLRRDAFTDDERQQLERAIAAGMSMADADRWFDFARGRIDAATPVPPTQPQPVPPAQLFEDDGPDDDELPF